MFALWYLTFAVDEIRKRLAWLFNSNKPAAPALDNKPANPPVPAAAPAPASKPVAAPSSPSPKPVPASAPAPTPAAKPATLPTPAPAVAPVKPSAPTPASAPAPVKPSPVVAPTVPAKPVAPVTPKPSPPKTADTMPIPLPKSLIESNTNGNGTNGQAQDLESRLFDDQSQGPKAPVVDIEQLKDASNDFIKGEANAFVQSIKEAQKAGER
ncbi:uncharacterized protein Dwil_GK23865 [Drosophila willistoni]|nr:uncharacterized protein Dwil_GK23865 [Drosophila willistoni]